MLKVRRPHPLKEVDRVVFITGGVFTREVREFVDRTDHEVLEKPLLLEDMMEVFEGLA